MTRRIDAPGTGLLVFAPLAVEAAVVRRALPGARVVRAGMGRERALGAVRRTPAHGARAVLVAGLAGGVAPGLRAGDVVVATELHGPDTAVTRCPAAAEVAGRLRQAGLPVHLGPVASSARLVRGAGRAAAAARGALAVDMESAWLAEAATAVPGAPLAVVRVVVDTPERGLAHPGMPAAGLRALRRLRAAAEALRDWPAVTGRSLQTFPPLQPVEADGAVENDPLQFQLSKEVS